MHERILQTRRRHSRPALLAVIVALLFGGCADAPPAPPEQPDFLSEADVLAQRERKDENYRSAEDSPIPPERRESFAGLSYYPYDPALRFLVRLERHEEPISFTIVSTEGEPRPAVKLGKIRFEHLGREHQLEVYSLRDLSAEHWDSLFLPFKDETTGTETYAAGRYVELANRGDDWYVLDFNTAYNPLCAYGRDIYRCPSTPAENRLSVAIRAGERGTGLPEAAPGEAALG